MKILKQLRELIDDVFDLVGLLSRRLPELDEFVIRLTLLILAVTGALALLGAHKP